MDREMPMQCVTQTHHEIIRDGGIGVTSIVVINVLISLRRTGVEANDLVLSTVY
jgi:hypothetical protein